MDAPAGIACVIYAAKSTADKRGSIPDQLRECREAIEADPRRRLVAEYTDESFSAYHRDRGPGLRDATQHAEDLAAEHGIAELWAQHSDRLARGDGRKARHTVEIALWALKHDVRVRTLQDPETFRDLLYAVVTGQRNNEDSSRRGLASRAGTRRAALRGDYLGNLPDGYQLHTWLDERQELRKAMVLDLERQELIELIFRLALRGRSCGQIATSVNKAGWVNKPVRQGISPCPFDVGRIYAIVKNPRYAGLSLDAGEVMARNCWPAYISEREHERLLALLRKRQMNIDAQRRLRETYLLKRLARCGRCGAALHAFSGRHKRSDGTRTRTYLCSGHASQRGEHQCDAPPIQANEIEAMVVASASALLAGESPRSYLESGTPAMTDVTHEELRAAALAGDEKRLDRAMASEFARMQPHVALIRDGAISQRQARELAETERLRAWAELERRGRTATSRAQCQELNELLRSWFSEISIEVQAQTVVLTAARRNPGGPPRLATKLEIDRTAWARATARASSQVARYTTWKKAEILGALQGWTDVHGRSPSERDWRYSAAAHPCAQVVRRALGPWDRALRRAGLPAAEQPTRHAPWKRREIVKALRAWSRRHGRSPASMEWVHAAPGRPCTHTVRKEFGCWAAALEAAGLTVAAFAPRQAGPWAREEILAVLRTWAARNGRAPSGPDWIRSAAGRPCTATVYKRFGSWGAALEAAGLAAHERP